MGAEKSGAPETEGVGGYCREEGEAAEAADEGGITGS